MAEIPRLRPATSRGSPAATSEPKASSRTTAAASKPAASTFAPPSAFRISLPPSSIRTPAPLSSSASWISRFPVSAGTCQDGLLSPIRVKPILPSREKRAGSAAATPWSPLARARKRSTAASAARLRAPVAACQTTFTLSPDRPGKWAATRSEARLESEPGVEKLASKLPATRGTRPSTAAKTMSQPSRVRPRRR